MRRWRTLVYACAYILWGGIAWAVWGQQAVWPALLGAGVGVAVAFVVESGGEA